jgi:SAM-dependent MidA family methyltransferase
MMKPASFFKDKVQEIGKCPFVDYMQMALYDPDYGYYTTKSNIFGKKGDFITAPELSPLFGFAFARQIHSILKGGLSSILELGAGSGQLCVDILTHLKKMDALPEHYFILELSHGLKSAQQERIAIHHPELMDRVVWLSSWPDDFSGVVVANEVLDAMTVHRFLWKEGQVFESYIYHNEASDKLDETFIPSTNLKLIDAVKKLNLSCDAEYCSEVNLWLDGWLKSLYSFMQQGVVFLVDYGYPQHEYYHPDRHQGTIMCHAQHHSHPHFLENTGLQDITAHVDFTAVAESAHELGFDILGFTNQASFLLANGILELLAEESDTVQYQEYAAQLKILLQSHEMGEIFKVIALGKNYNETLSGFMMFDRRVSL